MSSTVPPSPRSGRRRLVLAATLGAVAVLTATGVAAGVGTATRPAPAVPAATASATTAWAATTQVTTASAIVTASATTAKATTAPAVDGDVDGDGRTDVATIPVPGSLRVDYADGAGDTVPFRLLSDAGVAVLGLADADRDGRAEVFVGVGSGASTEFASVFRHVRGELALVTINGSQVMLAYGGSVANRSSWGCRPAAPIVTWAGTSEDGVTYPGTLRSYRFVGATLVQKSARPFTVTPDRAPPGRCGSIRL